MLPAAPRAAAPRATSHAKARAGRAKLTRLHTSPSATALFPPPDPLGLPVVPTVHGPQSAPDRAMGGATAAVAVAGRRDGHLRDSPRPLGHAAPGQDGLDAASFEPAAAAVAAEMPSAMAAPSARSISPRRARPERVPDIVLNTPRLQLVLLGRYGACSPLAASAAMAAAPDAAAAAAACRHTIRYDVWDVRLRPDSVPRCVHGDHSACIRGPTRSVGVLIANALCAGPHPPPPHGPTPHGVPAATPLSPAASPAAGPIGAPAVVQTMTFWLAVRPAFRRQGLAFEALKAWLGHTFRSHAPVPVTGVVASPLAPPPPVTPPDTYDALAVAHDGDDDDDDDDDHHHVAATSTLSSASPPRTVPLDWRAFPTPPTPLAGGRTDARSASAALPQSAPALAMTTRSPPHRPRAAPRRPTSGHRSAVAQSLATVASRAVCASAPTHGAAMRVLEKMGMSRGFGLDVNLHAQPGPWYGLTRQEFTNLWGGDGDDDDDDDGDDDAADIHSTIALCDGAVDHQCRHFLQPCHESSIHSICSVSRVMYTSF